MKEKPVYAARSGSVKVAVWARKKENYTQFSITFEKRYKTDNEWKSTQTYFPDDLFNLEILVQEAFKHITFKEDINNDKV